MKIISDNTEPEPGQPLVIDEQGTLFKIYHTPMTRKGKEYPGFTLAYKQGGHRKRELSADLGILKARVSEVKADIDDGLGDSVTLRRGQRDEYMDAASIVKPTGVSLRVAAKHFAEAFKILGSDLVVLAAQEFERRHRGVQPKLVDEAVDEFLAERERANKSPRHQQTLKSHLESFESNHVVNVGSLTAQDINRFLENLEGDDKQPVSPRTRDNYALSIINFLRWCGKRDYLPRDFDEVSRITLLSGDEDGPVTIYTPDEMTAMLSKAPAKAIPFLAIGAFAGLRSSEIMRLDWSDVKLDNGNPCIVVQSGKVRKRGKSRRVVPASENLRAWLKPHTTTAGKVWPYHFTYLYDLLRDIAEEAKLKWKSNALRHSRISYRVALDGDVNLTALESGNSPEMIFSNYREVVTKQDAEKWFAIVPPVKPKRKGRKARKA